MQILNTVKARVGDKDRIIYFGLPDNQRELDETFRLRFKIYAEKNYIDSSKFPNGLEEDEHDFNNQCSYFIAKIDEQIIGFVRIIKDNVLPTEKYFKFFEPEAIKNIPDYQRCELGRLIVAPFTDKNGKYLPRHIVLLFLIKSLVDFGIKNNILGGYAFIKDKLKKKFKKLRIPIYLIYPYEQTYPTDGILYQYFSDKEDPVMPIYFLTAEIKNYIEKLASSFLFKKRGDNIFILRTGLYNTLIKILSIL